jgi:ProQ/FINO family
LWPLAFPKKPHPVKPLASGIVGQIAERMGWSTAYARGVLQGWKLRDHYCEAVLRHDRRSSLDGEEVAESVDDTAREMARKRLATLAARRLKAEQERAAGSAKRNVEISDSAARSAEQVNRRRADAV